jgi:hypothetical protein
MSNGPRDLFQSFEDRSNFFSLWARNFNVFLYDLTLGGPLTSFFTSQNYR